MTAAKVFFVSLALSCLLHSAAACWGAVAVSESLRPDASFVSQFPASPSVVVGAGESVNDKISACDGAVGSGGYCRVKITGTPSASGISISRSRTMIEGSPGVVLTGSGDMSFVYIGDNTNSIVIQDLEIRGHSTSYHAGVEVHGSDIASIVVKNCKIHSFMAGSGDAHAIIVRGTAGTDAAAVNNIIIESNTVYDMNLGSSEAIAINGNVRRWLIKGNSVRDVNNIAIDAIGGEGTAPTSTENGRVVPGPMDAAREGWIEDNNVENLSTVTNPAYGSKHSWAAAIYVDGARKVTIRNNVATNTAWGYEVGGENCVTTRDIVLEGNAATGSYFGDFVAGGYSTTGYKADTSINCDPNTSSDSGEGHGYVRSVTATYNTFSSASGGAGWQQNVNPQYRLTHTIIVDPNAEAVNTGNNGEASGDENAIKTTI